MTTINLLPPRYASVRAVRARRRTWSIACTATGLLSTIAIAVSSVYTPMTASMEAQLVQMKAERFALTERAGLVQSQLETHEPRVHLLERVARQPDWTPLLEEIAFWCAGQAQLDSIKITLAPPGRSFSLDLGGISESQEFVGTLVEQLRQSGRYSKVTLLGTQRVNQSTPQTYRFQIEAFIAGYEQQAEALR